MKNELLFLQDDYDNLPRGTAVIECKPTCAARFAKSLVGQPEPAGYYQIYGDPESEVYWIPRFKDLLGIHHPDAKEVKGPFVLNPTFHITRDRLPDGIDVQVSFVRQWPLVTMTLCIDDRIKEKSWIATPKIDLPFSIIGIDVDSLCRLSIDGTRKYLRQE